ncbi:monodehydroascorbate reductase [Aureococcus anophagefferens]|nr:monodehydroascorbate reductase [Aureococcus anophagefferens]
MATFVAETIWDGHLKHALGARAARRGQRVREDLRPRAPHPVAVFGPQLGVPRPEPRRRRASPESYASTKVFGAFWVLDNRVVGCFLEGGTPSQRAALPEIARLQPQITRVQKFRKLSLDQFLDDPRCLEPPELAPGEFQAELDVECIVEAFQRYDSGDARRPRPSAAHARPRRGLGREEEAEALRALDPYGNNMVSLDAFTQWWAN